MVGDDNILDIDILLFSFYTYLCVHHFQCNFQLQNNVYLCNIEIAQIDLCDELGIFHTQFDNFPWN